MEEKDRFVCPTDLQIDDISSLAISDISALNSINTSYDHGFAHTGITYTGPSFNNYSFPSLGTTSNVNNVKINADIDLPDDGDIKFGDVSLRKTLAEIADRLAILVPDAELEREYEELRQAREHYEYVKTKLQMLEKLKKTPVELPR